MHTMRIKALMEEQSQRRGRRLSLKEVSERTGISSTVLSKMTDPKGYVTNTRYIEALCRFFGVMPNDLFVFNPPIDLSPSQGEDD